MEAGEVATIAGQTSGRAQSEEAAALPEAATGEDPNKLSDETEMASTQGA